MQEKMNYLLSRSLLTCMLLLLFTITSFAQQKSNAKVVRQVTQKTAFTTTAERQTTKANVIKSITADQKQRITFTKFTASAAQMATLETKLSKLNGIQQIVFDKERNTLTLTTDQYLPKQATNQIFSILSGTTGKVRED